MKNKKAISNKQLLKMAFKARNRRKLFNSTVATITIDGKPRQFYIIYPTE